MKLLYYSTSYYASHGGSIQAIAFYEILDQMPLVSKKELFPEEPKTAILGEGRSKVFKDFLKKISLLQILLFYRRNAFYLDALEARLQNHPPDVVVLQTDSNFLQIPKLKRKFPHILFCAQINGSPFDESFSNIAFRQYFRRQEQNAYSHTDLNFFISDVLRKRMMGHFSDPQRDRVVQNGTDIEKFRPLPNKKQLRSKWKYDQKKFLIGYIGTIDEHKKLSLLVEAVAELDPLYPFLQLVVIGDGPAMPTLKSLIERANLEEQVKLMGWVSHDLINEHLNCFDLAVHHYANSYMSPLKIFEYLAVGLPVIGPDISSVREVFQDEEHLVLTGPSKEEIKQHLKNLLLYPEKANELAQKGRKYVAEECTWANYAEKIVREISKKIKEQL